MRSSIVHIILLFFLFACKEEKKKPTPKEYRTVTIYSNDSLTITDYIMDGDSVVAVTGYAAPPEYFERAEQRRNEREARGKKRSK